MRPMTEILASFEQLLAQGRAEGVEIEIDQVREAVLALRDAKIKDMIEKRFDHWSVKELHLLQEHLFSKTDPYKTKRNNAKK